MKRIIAVALATFGLATPTLASAQKGYVELGWRPPTSEELSKRKAYEDAKGSWSKKDGAQEMFKCLMLWAFWGNAAREGDDTVPSVAGDLTYSFADAQFQHFVTVLFKANEGRSDDAIGRGVMAGYEALAQDVGDNVGDKKWHKALGKCYVHPTRWDIDPSMRLTGPDFLQQALQLPVQPMTPPYVRDRQLRGQYDELVRS